MQFGAVTRELKAESEDIITAAAALRTPICGPVYNNLFFDTLVIEDDPQTIIFNFLSGHLEGSAKIC